MSETDRDEQGPLLEAVMKAGEVLRHFGSCYCAPWHVLRLRR